MPPVSGQRPRNPCLDVARALVTYGRSTNGERLSRDYVLEKAKVANSTFRSAGSGVGAGQRNRGLAFFDSSVSGKLALGPGAGLVLGISLGRRSLRATLVDANGWCRYSTELPSRSGQLDEEPSVLLDRIRQIARKILMEALEDDRVGNVRVGETVPLLGWAVAWPVPVDREKRPVGQLLSHPLWRNNVSLPKRVEQHLRLDGTKRNFHSYAINDAHAAAIAVAHELTHMPDYEHASWTGAHLTTVLRLAGGVGGATIVVEPPATSRQDEEEDEDMRYRGSGFLGSTLLAGVNNHAGEIGHTPVDQSVIDAINSMESNGLNELATVQCSCTTEELDRPQHLEEFTAVDALAHRIDPTANPQDVLASLQKAPESKPHTQALEDVGALVGNAMIGPTRMLNPAYVVLTGSLALPPVKRRLQAMFQSEEVFGSHPEVLLWEGDENQFIRAKGAALALIRNHVLRRVSTILDHDKNAMEHAVRKLTVPVDKRMLAA